MTGFDAVKL